VAKTGFRLAGAEARWKRKRTQSVLLLPGKGEMKKTPRGRKKIVQCVSWVKSLIVPTLGNEERGGLVNLIMNFSHRREEEKTVRGEGPYARHSSARQRGPARGAKEERGFGVFTRWGGKSLVPKKKGGCRRALHSKELRSKVECTL